VNFLAKREKLGKMHSLGGLMLRPLKISLEMQAHQLRTTHMSLFLFLEWIYDA